MPSNTKTDLGSLRNYYNKAITNAIDRQFQGKPVFKTSNEPVVKLP
jgi:hypothetical protein